MIWVTLAETDPTHANKASYHDSNAYKERCFEHRMCLNEQPSKCQEDAQKIAVFQRKTIKAETLPPM